MLEGNIHIAFKTVQHTPIQAIGSFHDNHIRVMLRRYTCSAKARTHDSAMLFYRNARAVCVLLTAI